MITQAMANPRSDGGRLGLFLGLLYSLQGRALERERVIEASWDRLNEAGEAASERAILLVRLHIQDPPIEDARSFLDQVSRSAPDDDRGWLGQARLAIRDGAFDKAARWLEACTQRRPTDIPVWRTRLDLALRTRRLAGVRQALAHLPAAESDPAEIQRLVTWLASLRGDVDAERRALARLIELDPADHAALDRLAALADKEGESDRAADYRRAKLEVGRLRERYQKLFERNQTVRDAAEMASVAEKLGRRFEARALNTIAAATQSGGRDQTLPSNPSDSVTHPQRGTLADVIAEDLTATDRATAR
jgi:tetratricopeptide (TPR) repeat protein